MAHTKGVYNQCAKDAGVHAATLDPDAFPITGESEVHADKTHDPLLSASFIHTLKRGGTVIDVLEAP